MTSHLGDETGHSEEPGCHHKSRPAFAFSLVIDSSSKKSMFGTFPEGFLSPKKCVTKKPACLEIINPTLEVQGY